ncbi:MAG: YfcC family protein [Firmicutes bacterium]|nr:YfcC family protein [Bacillota bacterium]
MSVALERKKKKKVNHPFYALTVMVIIVAIATHIIPAGEFSRTVVDGRTIVDPTSYELVAKNPTTIADFFQSFYFGFKKASGVMGLVFFIGGAFGVIKGMGLLDIAVKEITNKVKSKGILLIAPIVMTAIFFNVTFTGMRELDVIFVTLMIPICISLGYDTMTALGVVLVGSVAGFAPALANPFFTGIAHEIAELPIYSAMWYRALIAGIFLITGIIYVIWYANKVKKDPSKSLMADLDSEQELRKFYEKNEVDSQTVDFSLRMKLAGLSFLLLFGFMIFGTLKLNFGFAQLSGVFVAMVIVPGLIGGLSGNEICDYFNRGCADILTAVLIIFFARSILVLLEDARIIDTIIHTLAGFITGTSSTVAAVLVYISQTIINFVIPSGSGQAVITMPIITPLADIGEINRQVACLASQLGDGLTNYIYITNGGLLAVLAIAKVPYTKWVKFFLPLFLFYSVVAGVFIAAAQIIDLGPF